MGSIRVSYSSVTASRQDFEMLHQGTEKEVSEFLKTSSTDEPAREEITAKRAGPGT